MNFIVRPNTLRSLASKTTSLNVNRLGLISIRHKSFKVQDDKDFLEKVQNSKEPVIVDFFATWCGPCKALEPRLESILAKRDGKITVAKVDIDSMGELAAKYEVSTIPALVVFRDGKVQERLTGLQDEAQLGRWVDKVLGSK